MRIWLAVAVGFISGCFAHPLAAGEAKLAQRGAQGLASVAFRAANRSDRPIECDAALAHWYSATIGRAEPRAEIAAELWSDVATGAVYILNAVGDRMPVVSLWCGFEGRPVSTRADILLSRLRGSAEPAITVGCRGPTAAGRLDCRREHVAP